MTRALITDPDLPRKARDGRADDVLRCIGCNTCIAHYHAAIPIACAQNPRTGRELTWTPVRAARRQRVGSRRRWARRDGRRGGGACGRPRRRALRVEDPPGRTGRARRRRSRPRRARGVTPTELRTSARRRRRAPRRARGGAAGCRRRHPGHRRPAVRPRPSRLRGILDRVGRSARQPPRREDGSWSPTGAETPRGSTRPSSWRRAATRSRSPSDRPPSARPCTPTSATSMPRASTGPESRSGTTSSSLRGTAAAPRFTNIFAPELEAVMEADALVLALGRVPVRELEVQGAARGRRPALAALARGGDSRGVARRPLARVELGTQVSATSFRSPHAFSRAKARSQSA